MSTATNNDSRKSVDHASVFADPAALHEVLDEVFAELPLREAAQREEPVDPLPTPPTAVRRKPAARPVQVAYQPRPRTRVPADDNDFDWFYYAKQTICVGLMLLGAVLFYRGMPSSWRAAINPFGDSPAATAYSTPTSHTAGDKRLVTKRIEDARVGDRLVGRNPIREQADLVEPDPATWRKISLFMTKESGLGLWIDLLRPVTWIEEHNAQVGSTIHIDLYEMGAVGDAEVTYLGPCPKIQPGTGTVVTGTFKHQADENSIVVHLKLEDQIELTGVTDNHPYWSEDRQDFVEVGKLRTGELVDTEYGLKHVISVTPIEYTEFLYNLETTEHVFRVGSLGTLVHNSCVIQPYGGPGGGHHIFSKKAFEGVKGYDLNKALAIPQSEISRLGLNHLDAGEITQTQRRLFTELAESGRPNTLAEHARIARESLVAGGMSKKDAASVVRKALNQLKKWGVTSPSGIPWN